MANYKRLIVIGFFLVLFGFVGPLLMVIKVLESTFFLNFLSYGASITGLFLGLTGVSMYSKMNKKRD